MLKSLRCLEHHEEDSILSLIMENKFLSINNLEVRKTSIGYGVFTTTSIKKSTVLTNYGGKKLSKKEALSLTTDNSYQMFYKDSNGKNMVIDAVEDDGSLGRLINHSSCKSTCINLEMKGFKIRGEFHILAIASRNITLGEELLYSYNDRETIKHFACPSQFCKKNN